MKKQQDNTMTDQIEAILSDIAYGETEQDTKMIHQLDEEHIQIKSQLYRIAVNYREGFQLEAFENRYQDFFEKYDFIVGDWGYEQLRLRGFYQVNRRKVARDQTILFLDDYLKEYCNFGCQYFVLAKDEALGKYQQTLNKQKNHTATPVPEKAVRNTITTKAGNNKLSTRYKKKRQVPRSKSGNETPQNQGEKPGGKSSVKEEFQIKSQVKRPVRKSTATKNQSKESPHKEETKIQQTKQRHTTKKGSFVIKQKKKTP